MTTESQHILIKALMLLLTHKPHAVSPRMRDWSPDLHGFLGQARGHIHYCDRAPGIHGILDCH